MDEEFVWGQGQKSPAMRKSKEEERVRYREEEREELVSPRNLSLLLLLPLVKPSLSPQQ